MWLRSKCKPVLYPTQAVDTSHSGARGCLQGLDGSDQAYKQGMWRETEMGLGSESHTHTHTRRQGLSTCVYTHIHIRGT